MQHKNKNLQREPRRDWFIEFPGYFSCCYNKIADKNLWEEGDILDHHLGVQIIMAGKVWWQKLEKAGHTAIKKQKMKGGPHLAFSFLWSPGSLAVTWHHPQLA